MEYELTSAMLAKTKRLIGQSCPGIKSSHRSEALARGIGYGTNAALVAALGQAPSVTAKPSRLAFESFLSGLGYDVAMLQVSLLSDAVRLGTGAPWKMSCEEVADLPADRDRPRRCLQCLDGFYSQGRNNLLCHATKIRDGRVPGVQHANHVLGETLTRVFHRGGHQGGDYLRARPGWTDILDGKELADEVREWLAYRKAVREGWYADLPEQEQFLLAGFGERQYLASFTWHDLEEDDHA